MEMFKKKLFKKKMNIIFENLEFLNLFKKLMIKNFKK